MFQKYRESQRNMSGTKREELVLPVEWDIIDACVGFSFDIGGSVMKIIFVDKNDYIEPSKRQPNSKGKLRLVNFSRKELDHAFQFILDRARITKPKEGEELPLIYTTGYGATEAKEQLTKVLRVKNNQLLEFDCFNQGLIYLLKNLPRCEVAYPLLKEPFELQVKKMEAWREAMVASKGKSDMMDKYIETFEQMNFEKEQVKDRDPQTTMASDDDLFPAGIMMCGSAFAFSVIQADGSSQALRACYRGGKTFLGLASLLVDTNNFDEIFELAAKGDPKSVSTFSSQVMNDATATDEDDLYGQMGEMIKNQEEEVGDDLVFCYGNADGKRKEDFKRQDLARCLIETQMNDLVSMTLEAAFSSKVKHVFFCGGFVNKPLARQIITEEWVRISNEWATMDPNVSDEKYLHFLVHGQSLGSLGALLNHKLKWSETYKEETAQQTA